MPPPPRPPKGGAKPWVKGQTDDLASMAALDEHILLAELEERYKHDQIYTYVGDILVAINPFKHLNNYTPAIAAKYHDAVKSSNSPHIFAIADQAYYGMKRTGKNQCAVVSGESGAGKTESAKYMIKQIIDLSHTPEGANLETKIIQVNPLLEAFGNAKTTMNNNSSRFGKYTELIFDGRGGVTGAKISEYLLEKVRVVTQNDGDRNFHIFYYLFGAADASRLSLSRVSDFAYLYGSDIMSDNQSMLAELLEALKVVGFSGDEQLDMRSALAGILHMGNITFDGSDDEAHVSSAASILTKAAGLLGLDEAAMQEGLLCTITVTRGEQIRKKHNPSHARDVRDALCKQIYGRIFGWIVSQVNFLLAPQSVVSQTSTTSIGILDIFGFENFVVNGFEQLCINVTNEQLQNFFNKHIFENELAEYRKEGVDATQISFVDNGPLLDMFFTKLGMFSLLDEECHFPRASDRSLVQKYAQNLLKQPYYETNKMDEDKFTLKHYAGSVEYTSHGFLERNRDTLAPALVTCCQKSANAIIQDVFLGSLTETGALQTANQSRLRARTQSQSVASDRRASTASRKSPTVGAQFTTSLKILMQNMMTCSAHFVRCIKPNLQQNPGNFIGDFVNKQLSYTGMLETCRIRREGYSYRPRYDEFMDSFGLLAFGSKQNIEPSRATCEKVMQVSQLKGWLMGRSKVFLKYWHVEQLDKQLRRFENAAIVLQKWGRRFLAQKLLKRLFLQSKQEAKDGAFFVQSCGAQFQGIAQKLQKQNAEDAARKASGKALPTSHRVAPPPPRPELSEAELKREASIMWFQTKEVPRGAAQDSAGSVGKFLPWFHGLISRKEAERLLAVRPVGCFLVRLSENRFGYTLSYRIRTRCRHYMVEQDAKGRYALVGVEKICNSLNELINWFQRNQINEEGEMLREPCGQEVDEFGEEQCDYGELLPPGKSGFKGSHSSGGRDEPDLPPPPVTRGAKPGRSGSIGSSAPPSVSRGSKPAAGAPPPVSRSSKPRQ